MSTWYSFESGVLFADGDGPLSQAQIDSIWHMLPTTGASWIERGSLYVQDRDGGTVVCLGPVEPRTTASPSRQNHTSVV